MTDLMSNVFLLLLLFLIIMFFIWLATSKAGKAITRYNRKANREIFLQKEFTKRLKILSKDAILIDNSTLELMLKYHNEAIRR